MYLSIMSYYSSVLEGSICNFYLNLTKMATFPPESISLFIVLKQVIEYNTIT